MGQVHGREGNIGIGSNALALDSWTLTRTSELHETQHFGSTSYFKERAAGLKDWEVRASGLLDKTDTQQLSVRDQLEDGSESNISLLLQLASSTAGETYTGNGKVSGDVITHTVGDMVRWECTLMANGELQWSPAT